jgi:hypothetical protein
MRTIPAAVGREAAKLRRRSCPAVPVVPDPAMPQATPAVRA